MCLDGSRVATEQVVESLRNSPNRTGKFWKVFRYTRTAIYGLYYSILYVPGSNRSNRYSKGLEFHEERGLQIERGMYVFLHEVDAYRYAVGMGTTVVIPVYCSLDHLVMAGTHDRKVCAVFTEIEILEEDYRASFVRSEYEQSIPT